MGEKKSSPESEHLESNLKEDPSTIIPDPGQERQPYGASGTQLISSYPDNNQSVDLQLMN